MKQPLISVILPIYNVEKYIRECLDSLLNQTIGSEHLEIIMVNDCSTDNTAEIMNEYAERYENFKAIHLEENSGAPGKPRNIGIEAATGKYLIFLDPDDYVPADAYEKLYDVAHQYDSDFVMGKLQSFNESDGSEFVHTTFRDFYLQKNYFNVNIEKVPFFLQVKTAIIVKLVKTSFIKENGIHFIEGMKNGEDKYYDVQLFTKAKKFSYIPYVVYKYRARNDDNNLSMTQQSLVSSMENDVKSAVVIKEMLSMKDYHYFQINVLRSVLWRVCDPEFNRLSYDEKVDLLKLIYTVVKDYDKDIVLKYMKLEEAFLSLVNKELYDEAIEYNAILISRRWWFKKGTELQEKYQEQKKIRTSIYWKMTSPLRNRDFRVKKWLKRRLS
jgi:poly(ribitol-phosphate) beta-N-acetylglucosaminyltransferase